MIGLQLDFYLIWAIIIASVEHGSIYLKGFEGSVLRVGVTGQIGRNYFQTGLGEMYMVPEKQNYLEAESSVLATL